MPTKHPQVSNSSMDLPIVPACSDTKSCPIPHITLVFVKDLADNVRGVSNQVQEFSDCLQKEAVLINTIKVEFDAMKDNFQGIVKLVRDGNGQPSLMSRMSTLEHMVSTIKDDVKDMKETKKENFTTWVAVICAIISALGGAFSLFGGK